MPVPAGVSRAARRRRRSRRGCATDRPVPDPGAQRRLPSRWPLCYPPAQVSRGQFRPPRSPIYVEAHRKGRSIGESFIGVGYVICYVLNHARALAGSVCGPALHRHRGAGGVRGRGDGDRAVVAVTDAGPLANGNGSPYPLRDLSTPHSPGRRAVPYGAGGRPRGVLPGTMP
jgi:hypothetical protein